MAKKPASKTPAPKTNGKTSNGKGAKKPSAKAPSKKAIKKTEPKAETNGAPLTQTLAMTVAAQVLHGVGAKATLVDLHKALEDELLRVQDAMGEVEEMMEMHGEEFALEHLAR